jgi:hypothetical protein
MEKITGIEDRGSDSRRAAHQELVPGGRCAEKNLDLRVNKEPKYNQLTY